jgi:hypothetical protein
MTVQHTKLLVGSALDSSFVMFQHGSEVQLYWPDGEMSAMEIPRGKTALETAQQWADDLVAPEL